MTTFISTATVPQITVVDRRQSAAMNLAVRHLSEREAKHISARQVAGRLVWKVQSQTSDDIYTVTLMSDGWEADTCNCPDHVYRGTICKHIRAAALLSTPAPAPSAPRKVRRERVEEI